MKKEKLNMTRDEQSLLLYLETCAVDYQGRVDSRRLNGSDCLVLADWVVAGYVHHFKSLLGLNRLDSYPSCIILSEEALKDAHRLRTERIHRNPIQPDNLTEESIIALELYKAHQTKQNK